MHDVARFFTPYVASSRQADFIALLRTVTDWNQESNSVHRKSRFTLEQNLERASYFGETLEIAQPALLLSDTIYSPCE